MEADRDGRHTRIKKYQAELVQQCLDAGKTYLGSHHVSNLRISVYSIYRLEILLDFKEHSEFGLAGTPGNHQPATEPTNQPSITSVKRKLERLGLETIGREAVLRRRLETAERAKALGMRSLRSQNPRGKW